MADLAQIGSIRQEGGFDTFTTKVKAAGLLHAQFILANEDLSQQSEARVGFVEGMIQNPDQYMQELTNAVVSDHAGKSVEDIIGLPDSDIQTSVQVYVDEIYA